MIAFGLGVSEKSSRANALVAVEMDAVTAKGGALRLGCVVLDVLPGR
jgi:hypothetical protein